MEDNKKLNIQSNSNTPDFCSSFSKLIFTLQNPRLYLNGKQVFNETLQEEENVRCKRLPDGKSEVVFTTKKIEVDSNPCGDWGYSPYQHFKTYETSHQFFVQQAAYQEARNQTIFQSLILLLQ